MKLKPRFCFCAFTVYIRIKLVHFAIGKAAYAFMSKTQSVFNLELRSNLACNLLHSIFFHICFSSTGH